MKFRNICILALGLSSTFVACKKEESPVASDDLKIPQMFGPAADADPKVKSIYNDYGLWIRMDFKDSKEVSNGILFNDVNNRFGATKIDDSRRQEAITYTESLLSNVPVKYTKALFPLEFFYVKTYNGSWWASDMEVIGRSRLVITWPNHMPNTLPVTDPATHYYRDSVLTRAVWSSLGTMMTPRMEKPIEGFELAGKAYDGGLVFDRIYDEYRRDYDVDKRDAALDELAITGGFIAGSGSRSFEADFPQWITLIATESFANIKQQYLDNSPRRAKKYEVLIKFFNSYGWDIQATGNKYRQKLDLYK
ncbi:MAG: hypothetical protein P0Y49_05375 [Candidatus Pedobacter colombiensis]|uniref:Uncharacterized protein n=1 Tax=Candidatus Pedobacter colombiensis TaxID=3121371 RepID=A0AAJ6B6Z8_9SPHI|nr:hypothetical protein [Pedobacter sp.]WEK20567.1 MAG: hypothetical protein P0Y49_05375 [Pedobacter sp.]